jgi:hypothetical protein
MMAAMDMMRRTMVFAACAAAALIVAAACGDDDESPVVERFDRRPVLAGPQCPVVMGVAVPGLAAEATLRVDEVGGGSSETVESDSDGRFKLRLPLGESSVVALPVVTGRSQLTGGADGDGA